MRKFAILAAVMMVVMLLVAGTAAASPQLTGADPPVGPAAPTATPITPGWTNSNRSGEPTVAGPDGIVYSRAVWGAVYQQLTHTDFKLNTNSCASCHMTHTAVGPRLLIRNTTNNTCLACHDGTMGFLNVNAPATGTAHNAEMGGSVAAGTFALQAGRTPSWHDATGAVNISGAPGGRRDGTGERGAWAAPFTCASCHAPHGSHSIRLLHFNPNRVAVRAEVSAAVYGVEGGRYRVSSATNIRLAATNWTYDTSVTPAVYRYTLTGAPAGPWVSGYTVAHTGVPGGRVAQFWTRIYHINWDPNTVAGGVYADPTVDIGAANSNNLLTRHFIINFAAGTVMQTDVQRAALMTRLGEMGVTADTAELRIDVARGLQVRARAATAHQGNLVVGARANNFIDPATYDAPAYNLFCAACHTDYLPTISGTAQRTTRGAGVGIYSTKFRHTINRGASAAVSPMPVRGFATIVAGVSHSGFTGANLTGTNTGTGNQMMCLSCHFAHGVDASMMLFANNTRVSAGSTVTGSETYRGQNDVSGSLAIAGTASPGSSALKRYINQASCWHCHVRSAATVFINTDYYWRTFPQGPTW